MDTSWFEDFLALAARGNFSRAAEQRGMTQPAFSRRIKALEDWVGAPLFDRATHRVELTAAGECLRPEAEELLRHLQRARAATREVAQAQISALIFAATHALSLTFFPAWLRAQERDVPLGAIQLVADNMNACEQLMLEGRAHFLLCHDHPGAPTRLGSEHFLSYPVGQDVLMPVCALAAGQPAYTLPGAVDAPLPFLAFSAVSGMGQILAAAQAAGEIPPMWLRRVFTSHVATVLKSMASEGRGIAWSPLSLIDQDLRNGSLARAGGPAWDVPVSIRLFRPRARQTIAAEAFWRIVTGRLTESPSGLGRGTDG